MHLCRRLIDYFLIAFLLTSPFIITYDILAEDEPDFWGPPMNQEQVDRIMVPEGVQDPECQRLSSVVLDYANEHWGGGFNHPSVLKKNRHEYKVLEVDYIDLLVTLQKNRDIYYCVAGFCENWKDKECDLQGAYVVGKRNGL